MGISQRTEAVGTRRKIRIGHFCTQVFLVHNAVQFHDGVADFFFNQPDISPVSADHGGSAVRCWDMGMSFILDLIELVSPPLLVDAHGTSEIVKYE